MRPGRRVLAPPRCSLGDLVFDDDNKSEMPTAHTWERNINFAGLLWWKNTSPCQRNIFRTSNWKYWKWKIGLIIQQCGLTVDPQAVFGQRIYCRFSIKKRWGSPRRAWYPEMICNEFRKLHFLMIFHPKIFNILSTLDGTFTWLETIDLSIWICNPN